MGNQTRKPFFVFRIEYCNPVVYTAINKAEIER
jgi:hypothetical protein